MSPKQVYLSTYLDLTEDICFKSYFKRNPLLLKALLENFLPLSSGTQIEQVQILDSETAPEKLNPQKNLKGKVFIMDLRLQISTQVKGVKQVKMVNVEMQTSRHPHLMDRVLAYASRTYSEQLQRGDDYKKLKKMYSLVFAVDDLTEFKSLQEWYHVCEVRRSKEPHLVMSKGMSFVLVELGKFNKQITGFIDEKDKWCYLLKKSPFLNEQEVKYFTNQGGVMAKAVDHLLKISKEEALRDYEFRLKLHRMDEKAERLENRRRGLEEGKKEGREEGLKEGRKEGREEGREQGIEEGIKKVVLKMLNGSMDLESIEKFTGLPKEKIEQLKK